MRAPRVVAINNPGRIHVDPLTDEQLLTAVLRTNDPMGLDRIRNEPPPDGCELWFEMNYEADDNVRCVFGHMHKKGIILRDVQGSRYPIGHTCGRERYGLDWNTLENAVARIRERKDYLLRLRMIGTAIRNEEEWLSEIQDHPAVAAFDALKHTFATDAKELFVQCTSIARGSGIMWAEVEERDYAAEERRRERDADRNIELQRMTPAQRNKDLKRNGVPGTDKTPLFKKAPRSFQSLPGIPIFAGKESLKIRIGAYVAQIRSLADTCLQIPNIGDLPGISKVATRTFKDFAATLDEINQAARFFEYGNLSRVVEWANKADFEGLTFSLDGAALRIENHEEGTSARISRPIDLAAIETTALSNLLGSLLKAPP